MSVIPACGVEFLCDGQIYRRVIAEMVPAARKFLWIATADLKDLYVPRARRRAVPFLQLLSELIDEGVQIRLIHASEVGPAFQRDFDRFPNLIEGLERLLCPRCHFKSIIVDGCRAYSGSANLTGAGLGAKSDSRRNFESGFVTAHPALVTAVMEQFDQVWIGTHCQSCKRTQYCAEYKGMVGD